MVITRTGRFEHTIKCSVKPCVAMKWCVEQFGPRWEAINQRAGTWTVYWAWHRSSEDSSTTYEWHFLNEQDAILFSLKWL